MRQLKITHQITNRDSDSLERYLQEIARLEMVTPEEEVELARRIKKGDMIALDKLTKANLRFVVSVAKQYQNQGLSLSDLINEGNLGLIKAAQRFDETKGFKFISYAVWWIRQSILQALAENARMVRLPLNNIGSYSKLTKVMSTFEQEHEREPTPEELAAIMETTVKDIKEMMKGTGRHLSVDAPVGDGEDTTMLDLMQDMDGQLVEKSLIHESLSQEVKQLMKVLNQRDAEIVSCYFGINGKPLLSLDEIASKYELTRERVRQIKEKAIRRIRKSSNSKQLKTYLGQ